MRERARTSLTRRSVRAPAAVIVSLGRSSHGRPGRHEAVLTCVQAFHGSG